jgi:hypothetical protein
MMEMNYNQQGVFRHSAKYFVILILSLSIMSCGGGDDGPPSPTPQEAAEALLIGAWDLSGGSITLDGVDVSSKYNGFVVTIGAQSLNTSNGGDLFTATGTWQWSGESDSEFITGSGKEIVINTLTTSTFSFSFTKTAGNSPSGIPGIYVINLSK